MTETSGTRRPIKRETLAEQVASDITQRILSRKLEGSSALPTEPELAQTYGVSRSVIRDATRLLLARGLVQVQHGKGVFVTSSQKGPFADALLLALKRDGATMWDVDEFTQYMTPVAVALATANASDAEIAEIERLSREFLDVLAQANQVEDEAAYRGIRTRIEEAMDRVHDALFAATHNKVLQHLASPLRELRQLREWDFTRVQDDIDPGEIQQHDRRFFETMIECLRSRDPARAGSALTQLFSLPDEAVSTLKQTPVGEVPRIVITSWPPRSGG